MSEVSKLFIPDRINVGFQNRSDTYTGKLAYVIYYDKKGVLRKEASWQTWRDKKIDNVVYDNKPMEGFVLNKKVGGYKSDWNFRQAYVRVYDPRNFEIEITVPNLLFLLSVGDCTRGKGLEGKFVYAWDKTDLVLLPVECESYKVSTTFTDLSNQQVKAKELVPGLTYQLKDTSLMTYLGKLNYYFIDGREYSYGRSSKQKKSAAKGNYKQYVFWKDDKFVFQEEIKNIAKLHSTEVHGEFAELVEKYNNSRNGSPVVSLFEKTYKGTQSHEPLNWFVKNEDGSYTEYESVYDNQGYDHEARKHKYDYSNGPSYVVIRNNYKIVNGSLVVSTNTANYEHIYKQNTERYIRHMDDKRRYGDPYSYYSRGGYYDNYKKPLLDWIEPTKIQLYCKTQNGGKFKLLKGGFAQDGQD